MTAEAKSHIALRLRLHSGPCSIPLNRVHQLAGYATLTGQPDDYFLGWLTFHGLQVPIFDLNLVVCDQPTPEHFGSRIMVLHAPPEAPTRYIGLLAAGLTDTVRITAAAHDPAVPPLDVDSYLPMLCTLIPTPVSAPPVASA
jgi:chemotaxis signal transduction protein